MIALSTAARWTAIGIAAAAVLDPAVRLPGRTRPTIRVLDVQGDVTSGVTRQLRDAGFALDEPTGEVAAVFVGPSPPSPAEPGRASARQPSPSPAEPGRASARRASAGLAVPLWVLDTTPRPPNVRVVEARGPAVRLPGQAVDVRVTLEARGFVGKTSDVTLEDAGIIVATARHEWKSDDERWHASLQYLPPGAAGGRLRTEAIALPGETSTDDNAADVGVPPMRGPIRTIVVEAGVTWPAVFARRAVEGEPAFAVAAVQRASTRIATRGGAPPVALTRDALAQYEVALVGSPDNLTAADVEALRWFIEQRGGVAVVIPDDRPGGRYVDLLGSPAFEARAVEAPVRLGDLLASEFLVTRRPPPGTRTLAATDAGEPVVFSARRGAGAVIFSGALDAWRHRAADKDAFARFWRRVIAEEAATVPPALEVSVDRSLIAPGESTRVRARLRATELPAVISVASPRPPASAEATAGKPIPDPRPPAIEIDPVAARAVSPGARVDEPIRLWPTAEPGVYEGEWRPPAAGDYNIAVTAGPRRGDAAVTVASPIAHGSTADPEGLVLAARTSGGRVFPADQSAALVEGLKQAFPARTVTQTMHPMRSSWWVVPFAGLLCTEWALRRRRGLP